MNKSYKCFYCKYDTPPSKQPEPNCVSCRYGSEFEMKKRMTQGAICAWERHKKLDQFVELCGIHFFDHQIELMHRSVEAKPSYLLLPRHSGYTQAQYWAELFKLLVYAAYEVPHHVQQFLESDPDIEKQWKLYRKVNGFDKKEKDDG